MKSIEFTNFKYFLLILPILFSSCIVSKNSVEDDPLDLVLKSNNPKIKAVMDNVNEHELQIIYTQIKIKLDIKSVTTEAKRLKKDIFQNYNIDIMHSNMYIVYSLHSVLFYISFVSKLRGGRRG